MPDTGAPWNIPFLDGTELVRAYPDFSEDLADAVADGLSAAGNAGIGSNVVQTVKTNTFTTSSTSFIPIPDLELSFTPSSATSKVLLHFGTTCRGAGGFSTLFELRRGSTSIGISSDSEPGSVGHAQGVIPGVGQVSNTTTSPNVLFLDSPGTGSAITYSVRVRGNGGTTIVGAGRAGSFITTLTAVEVAP